GLGLDEVLEELKRLRSDDKGSGSAPRLSGGELRVSRREDCVGDVASSLLCRQPTRPADKETDVPSPDPAATAVRAPGVVTGKPAPGEPPGSGRLSDSFTLSSAVLPGAGPARRSGGKRPT